MDQFYSDIESLFSGESRDLSGFTFTSLHKKWLAEHIISKEYTAASVSRKFNIASNTIHKWVHRYKKGRRFVTITGRPRVFDEKQLSDIADFTVNNPGAPLESYKHYISDLYEEFYSNVPEDNNNNPNEDLNDGNPRKIARNTLKAYTNLCLNEGIIELVPWVA